MTNRSVVEARYILLKKLSFLVVLGLFSCWQTALCIELLEVHVDVENGRYRVFGKSLINAPPEFVYATLLDYDNFYKLARGITETRYLQPEEFGERLAYTRFDSCVLLFCKTIEKVEQIDASPFESIQARAIPDLSDFKFNESRWHIENSGDKTLLTFEAEFVPDFWIPPLVGPWAIRRKLVKTAELIGSRIEWMHASGLTLAQVTE